MKFLKTVHLPQEISADQFGSYISSLTIDNGLDFSDVDLTPEGRKHSRALYVSIECKGTTLAHVLVDTGSSLNVLPKGALDRLDCKGVVLKPSDIIVQAFDRSKLMVHGEVDLPIKVGSQIFESTFYVMDIRPTYSCLLGRPWIHGAGIVTSTLHHKLKYPVKGKIVTVCGEEEYMVSHLNSFPYVEIDGEFIETPCQAFEVISPTVVEDVSAIPKTTKAPHKMTSLKDAKATIEEDGCTVWDQLLDIPYKSHKFGLSFIAEG